MKIALVQFAYPPDTAFGGIATYAGQTARLLSERGHYVEVFAASGRRSGRVEEARIGVNLAAGLDRSKFANAIFPIFTSRHREVGFDVVESPEYFGDGSEILRAHRHVAHVVKLHTPNGFFAAVPGWRDNWYWRLYRNARKTLGILKRSLRPPTCESAGRQSERNYARNCHLVVSPSRALANWAIQEWKLKPSKLMIVPYPYCPANDFLRISTGGSGMVVGYFGRLSVKKGTADLIEAVPLILKDVPEARFRFVGKPHLHEGTSEPFDVYLLRRLARFRHAIDVIGPRPLAEMPQEYQTADICVFPSHWDNFPNVCLEAMAAARAIVGSTAGGMAEMLENGSNGLLVPPRNPKRIAEAVIHLLQRPKLRESFGIRARQRVLEFYNGDRVGAQLEQSYRTAIALCLSNARLNC